MLKSACSDTSITVFIDQEKLQTYIRACVKICLLMAATDPPVVMTTKGMDGIKGTENGLVQVNRDSVTSRHNLQASPSKSGVDCFFEVEVVNETQQGINTANLTSRKETEKLDHTAFKDYTKTGRYVDFVVWPALYLHEGGPLLCKGVAQGTNQTQQTSQNQDWKWYKPIFV